METKNKITLKKSLFMYLLLLLFWVVIDGKITVESVLIGSVAAFAVIILNKDLFFNQTEGGPLTFKYLLRYARVIGVLLVEIVKANIAVAKIVLKKDMPIEPMFVKVPASPKKNFHKMLYGNLITLTPGTLTVDEVHGDFVIHAINRSAAEGLEGNTLERHVLELEREES
ncbi:Na+/H+ antiporter subunit E [Proteiniclasticum ruminis]|uniref:Multisubunit sodium/proton antiporter, MrpE subunit n=1 Tax=Proteiniclasticum ruminis TaxID=398199 RepID=A0A1I4Y2W1_9CLOT|nr:Na+/H+ antiporter subunit E [Proteiniclasticum ruminis]SFN32377.1 multisubunit sodium/proton antiporter, MrpE subunit [Proteiniclasticum ruminis]